MNNETKKIIQIMPAQNVWAIIKEENNTYRAHRVDIWALVNVDDGGFKYQKVSGLDPYGEGATGDDLFDEYHNFKSYIYASSEYEALQHYKTPP